MASFCFLALSLPRRPLYGSSFGFEIFDISESALKYYRGNILAAATLLGF